MSRRIKQIIENIIKVEGGFTLDRDDPGNWTGGKVGAGELKGTKYGISAAAFPDLDIENLTKSQAFDIYHQQYVVEPGFAEVLKLSEKIAEELVDTGVNMGTGTAATFLQRWLNAMNNRASFYADLRVDGDIGPMTLRALGEYLGHRGSEGETVLYRALNCSQGSRYLDLSEANERNEKFIYGWMLHRVS